jgi:uncharacterized protein
MTTNTNTKHPFCYVELHAADPDRATQFYRRLFDWNIKDPQPTPSGPYREVEPGEGLSAGLMRAQGPEHPQWVVYVKVADLAAAVGRARDLGATIVVENALVPDAGWFASLVDPTGAQFGMWQPLG